MGDKQMISEFQLLINGISREGSGGESEKILNPATGESIGRVAYAAAADLDKALEAVPRGLREWHGVPPRERGRILKNAADRWARKSMLTVKHAKALKPTDKPVFDGKVAGLLLTPTKSGPRYFHNGPQGSVIGDHGTRTKTPGVGRPLAKLPAFNIREFWDISDYQ